MPPFTPRPAWQLHDPRATVEHLGFLPSFLSIDDPSPLVEQLDRNYAHGGGWRPMKNWSLDLSGGLPIISYPGDEPMSPFASTILHGELLYLYPASLVLVLHKDGSSEIARMD